ncbi:MAG TPA: thioredoxin domain-containing protein [Solirubrobacteraceae bacterium]|jgi:protein-disulfide isomerase
MASRTKQKEEARARRIAEEQARAERAARTRRIRMLAGVVIGAVVLIVVAVVISTSSSSPASGPAPGTKGATQQAAIVNSLLAGIPQSGQTIGNPNAKATLTEYGDLECPICRDFALSSVDKVISNEVRAGKVKLVYKSYETATGGAPNPSVFPVQQAAAYAAGLQGKAWNYILLFYREQGAEGTGYVTPSYLEGLAKQIPGLNYNQWLSQYQSSTLTSQVQSESQYALSQNWNGTPTIIIQGPKGQTQPTSGAIPYSDLQSGFTAAGA